MIRTRLADDPEPAEPAPAGHLCVPVRPGAHGVALRLFRTPVGARTAVAFTTAERLRATLGADRPWVPLSEPALRALARPLGVHALTVDPVFTAPFTRAPALDGSALHGSAPDRSVSDGPVSGGPAAASPYPGAPRPAAPRPGAPRPGTPCARRTGPTPRETAA
ncbi:SAV_915 family protein [Streptomyces griseus]|uniref:SAV_915 family protein n=1 Tax=Streptomyces griseus TaxID=1911 RepID=UPI0007C860C9|nr:SAV_915 family protein [Streptomyces griseus]